MSKSPDKNSTPRSDSGAEPGQESSSDPFVRGRKYPNASSVFRHTGKSPAQMREHCLVVLDTNVLLVLYGTGNTNLASVAAVYQKLVQDGRLVVPGQVAREFADNRAKKLAELFQQMSIRSSFKVPKSDPHPLLDKEPAYQELVDAENKLREYAEKYNKIAARLLRVVGEWAWNDPVSTMYSTTIVDAAIVDPKFDPKELMEELGYRARHSLPPGYKDAHKNDDGVGDLLIWKTILQVAAQRKTDVLFVTLDGKADWWHRVDGRTLYPRYELVDEFWVASGGCTFSMCKLSELLELFGADGNAVRETKLVEEQVAESPMGRFSDDMKTELLREIGDKAAGQDKVDDLLRGRMNWFLHSSEAGRSSLARVMSAGDISGQRRRRWREERGDVDGPTAGRGLYSVDAEVFDLSAPPESNYSGMIIVHRLLFAGNDITYLLGDQKVFSGIVGLQRYLHEVTGDVLLVAPRSVP